MRNWKAVAAAAFVVWHVSAMLATGLKEPMRGLIWPAIGWYAEGLRMTNRFGMFARPPKKAVLVVMGERATGAAVELGTSASRERAWGARIVDVRLRKVQDKLLDGGARQHWGSAYLDWFCRHGAEQGVLRVRLEMRAPDELDDEGRVVKPARHEVLMTQPCKGES